MSSTVNVQNLLTNVFRPVYTYDIPVGATVAVYTPKLEMSNIDVYSGNAVSVQRANIGDANSNVYVGSNAGNEPTLTRNCFRNTAVGYNAGNLMSNVSNSVYLGFNAGNGAVSSSNVIAIGANSIAAGSNNIYIGQGTGGSGSNNIFIGSGINPNPSVSSKLLVGPTTSAITIAADFSTKWVGLGGTQSPAYNNDKLDISGNTYILGKLGINNDPQDYTLNVSGQAKIDDGTGSLLVAGGVATATNGFASATGTQSNVTTGQEPVIGSLKKGVIVVSAQDTGDITNYDSKTVYCPDPTDGSVAVSMSSNVQSGEVSIGFAGSNIKVINGTGPRDIQWSITYFPLI